MSVDRWISIVSAVLGLIGLLWGFWSHRRGIKRRIPTFVTRPSRHTLADPILTKLADIELLFEKHPIGSNGVTAVHVYFWNSGQLPILKADVIEP